MTTDDSPMTAALCDSYSTGPCLLVLAAHFGYHLFRRVRKTAKIDYQLRHVCPSVRPSILMEQLGSRWSDFHDIGYLRIFRKSVQKIHV